VAEQTGAGADDAYGGRPPTSHERMTGRPWDDSYQDGPAPWDIDRPQPAVVRLADEGAFAGAVLDAGCGTGENALQIAAAGLPVLGVDVAATALSIAREKARARGLKADFELADALQLARLDRVFETVFDCGLFHTFDPGERRAYVESLASVTASGGHLFLLCFSDAEPGDWGPHRITQEELNAAFSRARGWRVLSISPERIETNVDARSALAWLARIARIERG
jgi:SAM-dependent methyltransferase